MVIWAAQALRKHAASGTARVDAGGDGMSRVDRLFVIWRAPNGARRVIGDLWRTDDGAFAFAYRPQLPVEPEFTLLAEFPEHRLPDAAYGARYLFPTFGQRVPSPARSDRQRALQEWGVENPDDVLEILARSGGHQLTDRIELAEYRAEDDELRMPLEFRLAAASQPRFAGGLAAVSKDEVLELRRDVTNAHDAAATLVLKRTGAAIGFVPRQYSLMIARLLDADVVLRAKAVRCVGFEPGVPRWVVRVERAS
jgi:hypothetical protein